MIADDYLEDDDDDDLDLVPDVPRAGLVIPGQPVNEKAFMIEARGFVAAFPVAFVKYDEQTGEETLENLAELQSLGLTGRTADEMMACLGEEPPPSPELIAELIEAMQ